ncbi:MAG: hypothetical protein WAM42_05905, partial [Candidatus Nitrosopolaris sp.]
SDSYYRATEQEILEDYLKAVDMLGIDNDKLTLHKQVVELTEKSREENYVIKGKLQEKDDQINTLMKKQERFELLLQSLIDSGQLKAKIVTD